MVARKSSKKIASVVADMIEADVLAMLESDANANETVTDTVETNLDALFQANEAAPHEDDDAAPLTLRDIANAFDQESVGNMIVAIGDAFDRRDKFEAREGALGGSYVANRKLVLDNATSVAKFFLALNVSAESVICRKVVENAMFNAKALKKIVELARFTVSGNDKIESVMKCFLACSVAFNRNGSSIVPNEVNKQFISNMIDAERLVKDEALADALREYRGKTVTGGRDTQSSQARNVIDVLNIGSIVSSDNHSRGAIMVNGEHGLIKLFEERFMKAA